MAKEIKTSLARFKSAKEEFQLSFNPKTDKDKRYPVIDPNDESIATLMHSLGLFSKNNNLIYPIYRKTPYSHSNRLDGF